MIPAWVQIVIAVIGAAREMIKYMREQEQSKTARVERVKQFRDGMRKAREHGDTTDMENAFWEIAGTRPTRGRDGDDGHGDDRVPNDGGK